MSAFLFLSKNDDLDSPWGWCLTVIAKDRNGYFTPYRNYKGSRNKLKKLKDWDWESERILDLGRTKPLERQKWYLSRVSENILINLIHIQAKDGKVYEINNSDDFKRANIRIQLSDG